MLSATSTKWAPWYVIPSDRKWFAQVDAAAEGSVLEIRGADWPRVRPAVPWPQWCPRWTTWRSELPSPPATPSSRRRSRPRPRPRGSGCGRSRATLPTQWSLSTSTAGRHPEFDGSCGVLGVTRRAVPSLPISGITDWIVLPASIAHIRTKLRAAVLRRACRWLAAPVAPEEERRLAALQGLGMLDTPREAAFRPPRRTSPRDRRDADRVGVARRRSAAVVQGHGRFRCHGDPSRPVDLRTRDPRS